MHKIIERNLTLEFELDELAKDFGYNLEVDEHDDVYHSGYTIKDIKNMGHLSLPEKFEDVEKIFPNCLAMALEDAERGAWASYIRKERINALKNCFEKIDLSGGRAEYHSIEQIDVSAKAGITSVEIDEANNKVVIQIYNPEHLINAVVNGVGYVYPDLPAQVEASNEEIKKRFHNLKDYFEVYSETKPTENTDNRYSPDIDNDYLSEELGFRVGELTLEDVVEAVKDSIDEDNDANTIMNLATKFTDFKAQEIAEKLVKEVEADASNWKSNLSNFLENKLSLSEIKEEVQFSISNLIDHNNSLIATIGIFGFEIREKYPQLKELNFRIKFSDVDQNVICLFKGDNFLIKASKQNAIENFSQQIMEEL